MDGKSATQIGLLIGRTKNAVIGRVRRLGLPGRPSPIKKERTDEEIAELRQRREERSLAHAARLAARQVILPEIADAVPDFVDRPPAPVPPRPVQLAAVRQPIDETIFQPRSTRACQWIEGDPQKIGWTYCPDMAEDSSPYCAAHHKRCYVKLYDKERRALERQLPSVR